MATQYLHSNYDLIIVGKGVAGLSVLRELASSIGENAKNKLRIAILGDKFLAPTCSENSTAFVSHEAISRGHTALGDYLLDGFDYFKMNYSNLIGVEKAKQTRFSPNGALKKEAFDKRYASYISNEMAHMDSYLITPSIYLQTLENNARKDFKNLDIIEDFVVDLKKNENNWELKTHCKKSFMAKNIVLATGAMGNYLEIEKDKKRPVGGHYIEFEKCEFGEESFILSFENENVLYRHKQKTLQLSGFKVEDAECFIAPNEKERLRFYQDIKEKLKGHLNIPSLEEGKFYFGLREKPVKRLPYQREIAPNLFSIGGGYKNGQTLLPLMARELVTSQLRQYYIHLQ